MGPQVPLTPASLSTAVQALQVPSHAVSQQTPSAQKPLVHWFSPEHVAPLASVATHEPLEQKKPERQSPSPAQDVLHAVGPQMYSLQFVVVPATHVPIPSHKRSFVCVEPVHDCAMQTVVAS
jgi:hypothetical protein